MTAPLDEQAREHQWRLREAELVRAIDALVADVRRLEAALRRAKQTKANGRKR